MANTPLAAGFCRGIRPPPEEPLREWVCEHVYLPNSPEGARYSLEAVPAHGIIWDWIEDPEVKEIAVVACVGFGKTAIIEGMSVRAVAVDHGDMLVIGQTGKMVQDWMESRMRKTWEMSPLTNCHIPRGAERSNWKKESVIFRHMNFFAGSANETDLQEKSMVYTVGDEVWRWDDGMIDFLLKRHHGRWNRKNLLMSQGGEEDGQWHNHARAGKRHELEHICPHCTSGVAFDWNNFSYEATRDANEEFDWVAIFETVRLKCPHCGTEFEDTEYNRRQWAKCRPVHDGAKHIPGRMTLRASFMTVWRYSWRDIVKEWIVANDEKKAGQLEKLENVTCQRFAQFWKRPSDTPILNVIGDPYSKKEYHDGQKWELEDFRFMTVDVQQSHFWAIVSAWKIGGDSRVIWEGRLETWDNVRYLQERFGIENRCVFVDCGYRQEHVAKEALKAVKPGDANPWNLLKGEDVRDGYMKAIGEKRFRRPYSDYTNIQSSDGMRYRIIRFSNLMCKDRLATLMEGGLFGVPTDASKAFHAQMQSEQRREASSNVWRWVPVKSGAQNHLWDCSVMQVVAACLFKVLAAAEEVRKV
jgi:hypothetical protein